MIRILNSTISKTVSIFVFVLLMANGLKADTLEPFSIIVLPDVQFYSGTLFGGNKTFFFSQTEWIKNNKMNKNIVLAIQYGDLVQMRYAWEWAIADSAFRIIDHEVPYLLSIGNHDLGPQIGNHAHNRQTLFNEYFPPSRFQNNPLYNYGGNFDGTSTNYYLFFEAGGMKFMILSLEFKPRDEVLAWANEIVAAHQDRHCIVATHGFLEGNGEWMVDYIDVFRVEGNNAPEIWDKFLKLHKNIFLLLCGHAQGTEESRRSDIGVNGNTVHQLMANFQWWENGGNGFLRIMKFIPEENEIEVKTYSPVVDSLVVRPSSQFAFEYEMEEDIDTITNSTEQHPLQFSVLGNFPNPFNAETTITFFMPEKVLINVSIYNGMGQRIRLLLTKEKNEGVHSIAWNGCDDNGNPVASGLYFFSISGGLQRLYYPMMMIR